MSLRPAYHSPLEKSNQTPNNPARRTAIQLEISLGGDLPDSAARSLLLASLIQPDPPVLAPFLQNFGQNFFQRIYLQGFILVGGTTGYIDTFVFVLFEAPAKKDSVS